MATRSRCRCRIRILPASSDLTLHEIVLSLSKGGVHGKRSLRAMNNPGDYAVI